MKFSSKMDEKMTQCTKKAEKSITRLFCFFSAFQAKQFRDAVISEVAAGRMKVVCNGVSSKILPGLNDSDVRRFNRTPVGPHPVASFEVNMSVTGI